MADTNDTANTEATPGVEPIPCNVEGCEGTMVFQADDGQYECETCGSVLVPEPGAVVQPEVLPDVSQAANLCDSCTKVVPDCDAKEVAMGVDLNPTTAGTPDADKVLACDAFVQKVEEEPVEETSEEKVVETVDTDKRPKYRCHKEVRAHKIAAVLREKGGSALVKPYGEGFAQIRVDADFMKKHNPECGGYIVFYEDGYRSFSPAKAFENGYTLIN